jgi:uncharacterized protein YifN (PemK superfamily)
MEIPNRRDLRETNCTLDGKNNEKEGLSGANCKKHWFIVLTKNRYNEQSDCFLGVPISSKRNNDRNISRLNYGVDLIPDDIDGQFIITKPTLALCDRVSRVSKSDLTVLGESMIQKEKYDEIVNKINFFISEGKISD